MLPKIEVLWNTVTQESRVHSKDRFGKSNKSPFFIVRKKPHTCWSQSEWFVIRLLVGGLLEASVAMEIGPLNLG